MRGSILFAALLILISGHAMAAGADQRLHHQGSRVEVQMQARPGYDGPLVSPDWPAGGFGYYRPGLWWRRAAVPWSYPPYAACATAWCVPPYAFYWGFLAAPGFLPLAAVLDRLAAQDYSGFSSAVVEGANYNIIARNRYGQPVRLIVNAGNGQIRRILQ